MSTITIEDLAAAVAAMQQHGNQQAAANSLGLTRSALRRRLAAAADQLALDAIDVTTGWP